MALTSLDSNANAITAGTTQTLAGATAVTADVSSLTTGNASDGIVLPNCAPGKVLFVKNLSANAGKVYVNNAGTIDATAGATGVALAASKTSVFACTGYIAGTTGTACVWVTLLASA
jgi:hypothetical protein